MTDQNLQAAVSAGVMSAESEHRALLQSIVEVAWIGGAKIRSSGNSFATPHMSGICTLILAKHPELTPFQLKSVLYLTASNVGGAK